MNVRENPSRPPIVLGITGASGVIYAKRLLNVLIYAGYDVDLSISSSGALVIEQELGIKIDIDAFQPSLLLDESIGENDLRLQKTVELNENAAPGKLTYHHYRDFMAPMASGSSLTAGMVICPCSGGTLSGVVNADSANLIHRAADVHLKEQRKLILVPRETPLSIIQVTNLQKAAQAGAVVLPASPGWYHGVKSIDDLVDFIVARILDQLQVPHALMQRWGEDV
ncbi:MAG: 3-octaprenyl-4-hydroxybenzoate carboxy-lyase [Blastopirellula sp.]|nr:MAG: 3-octaprenyl-4-hydroxybenzoate carboxy-lyase [Blastopirellula sp.]